MSVLDAPPKKTGNSSTIKESESMSPFSCLFPFLLFSPKYSNISGRLFSIHLTVTEPLFSQSFSHFSSGLFELFDSRQLQLGDVLCLQGQTSFF